MVIISNLSPTNLFIKIDNMLEQKVKQKKQVPFYERIHPSELMVYLLMGSSAILFCVLIVVSAFSKTADSTRISIYFLLSTVTLLFSSKYSFRIKHLFLNEDWRGIRNSVLLLTLSGLLFISLQYYGWVDMKEAYETYRFNDFFHTLCALHVLHIVLMVLYTAKVFRKYHRMALDPIYTLVIQTNPFELKKITLLSQCWLYLDVIWILILMIFVI